ncbi:hypothetical protein LSH36_76g05036 [Paralvinella palmiformis]|uniref:cyclin-dependent kinase n=1 Tax=Paralvinella palmiformis TaxID=53620 RepID=A0AAD9K472_9ANNE|nr:hypothetical protein LSH36_76g05036 [Paralvinella palmiformis]
MIESTILDLGAVGCIFGELLNNSPIFPGENDIDQLCCVLRVLGTPNEQMWPGLSELPDYNKITFPENPPIPFEEIIPDASEDALDLIKRFLVYPSKQRIPASEASRNILHTDTLLLNVLLQKLAYLHPYFFKEPLPAHYTELPIPVHSSKKLRRAHQAREYNIDQPLEESLIDPILLSPHVCNSETHLF